MAGPFGYISLANVPSWRSLLREWELRGRCPWEGGLSEGDTLLGRAPKEGMGDPLMGKSRAQAPQPRSHALCPSGPSPV